jgi:hypothetical protein
MAEKRNKRHTDTRLKWVGYCIECEKWRNNLHTLTNVVTGQHRCSMCASVLLINCPDCKGDGCEREDGIYVRACNHCGGHRVVPQTPVGDLK